MEENEKQEQKVEIVDNTIKRINFFQKIWYSIAKPSKYNEMQQEGVGKSIKYFLTLLTILAIILSIVATILQVSVVKGAVSYLDEKLPNIKFKDNKLSLDGEVTILDEQKFIEYFGSIVVINPLIDKEQAIEEYNKLTRENKNVIVFLSDEYIQISENNKESENKYQIISYKYSDVSSKYIKDTSAEYSKESVISYINKNISTTYYLAQYFIIYLIMLALLYTVYIFFVSLSLWLLTKVTKIKWGYKKSLSYTIYASTLSTIIYVLYMIISYFAKFKISNMDIISIMCIYIYLYILLMHSKKKNPTIQ